MRKTYVFRDGMFVDKVTGERAVTGSEAVCVPFIVRDIPAYTSPIDGRVIDGRAARREDLKRNNCVEWEPGMGKKAEPRNEKFMRKYGMMK